MFVVVVVLRRTTEQNVGNVLFRTNRVFVVAKHPSMSVLHHMLNPRLSLHSSARMRRIRLSLYLSCKAAAAARRKNNEFVSFSLSSSSASQSEKLSAELYVRMTTAFDGKKINNYVQLDVYVHSTAK